MSQCSLINYKLLAQQQQKQLTTLQAQLQTLLTVQETGSCGGGASTEVAKPQVFDKTPEKVLYFMIACKLYLRMRMKGVVVEKQI